MTTCASDGSIDLQMNPVQEFSSAPREQQQELPRVVFVKRPLDGRLLYSGVVWRQRHHCMKLPSCVCVCVCVVD
jgi:hypothetical protein